MTPRAQSYLSYSGYLKFSDENKMGVPIIEVYFHKVEIRLRFWELILVTKIL